MTKFAESVEALSTFDQVQRRINLSDQTSADSKPAANTNIETTGQKVTAVTYPDGSSRKFSYDEAGLVVGIKHSDGTTWSRTGIGDEWNIDGVLKYTGQVQVDKKGTFMYEDWQGDKVMFRTVDAAGNVTMQESGGYFIPEKDLLAKYGQMLDWDKDRHLSNAELDSAETQASRGQIPLAQAGLAARIRQSYSAIAMENIDRFGLDNQVTFKDVEKFSDRKEQLFKSERLWRRADELKGKYFADVDTNSDGRLSAKELEQAANLASVSAPQKEMYQTMKAAAGKGKGLSSQDITEKHRSIFESSNFEKTFKTTFGYKGESAAHEDARMYGYFCHLVFGGMAYAASPGALILGGPILAAGYIALVAGHLYYTQQKMLHRIEKAEREGRYEDHLKGRL